MVLPTIISVAALVATLLFVLYLLLGPRRRGRFPLQVVWLLLLAWIEAFDLLALRQPERMFFWKYFSLGGEALLPLLTLAFAMSFYRRAGRGGWFSRILLYCAPIFLPLALYRGPRGLWFSPDFASEGILFLGQSGFFFYVGLMLYLALALVHLERTLTALPMHERWNVKFELIGAGLLPAVLLVYYSQSLLYRSLDTDFLVGRSLAVLLGVGLMAFSRIKRGAGYPIAVSRGTAFQSLVVLALSLYLVGLGLFGEGLRYLGVGGGKLFFVLVAVLSGCGLLALLLSENLRRKANVFLHKHFLRSKYDYREQWQEFTRRLAGAGSWEALQIDVLAFYCELFGFTGAGLYLKDSDGESFHLERRFRVGPELEVLAADNPLLRQLRGRDWIFNPADDAEGEACRQNPEFFQDGLVSLVVPLQLKGELEGMVVCGRLINSAEQFSYEDYDLLRALARQTTSALVTQRLFAELGAAREMAAMGRVSAFVLHDLKNQVSSLSLMVENAEEYLDDPEFQQDMLETLKGTIGKMKQLMGRLQNLRGGTPQLDLAPVDLAELAQKVAAGFGGELEMELEEGLRIDCDAEKISTVLLNLLLNAHEAGPEGKVALKVGRTEDCRVFLQVSDQGAGMTAEFIANQLFKPFVTTKKKGLGIGLFQCRQIIEAHHGQIEVESQPGTGTTFTIYLN